MRELKIIFEWKTFMIINSFSRYKANRICLYRQSSIASYLDFFFQNVVKRNFTTHMKQSFMKKRIGKGFAEIEFIISIFVFITTISFVTFLIISNIPTLHGTSYTERLKVISYQYSELLVFDEGAPKDWQLDSANANRVGFSAGQRYFLNKNKIDALASLCSDYQTARSKLALDQQYDITIEATYLDDSPVSSGIVCRPSVTTQLRPQFQTTRLAVLQDLKIVKIKVSIIG